MGKYDIFISYRRETGKITANHFHFVLESKGYRAFLDTNDLGRGDFDLALIDKIENCKDFMIILSPGALDRCSDPKDWVRRELACALKNKKNIVPVRMEGFSLPPKLPKEIDGIRTINFFNYDVTHFTDDIPKLEKKYLKSKPVILIRKILIGICLVLIAAGLVFWVSMKNAGIFQKPDNNNTVNGFITISTPQNEQPEESVIPENIDFKPEIPGTTETPDPSNIRLDSSGAEPQNTFELLPGYNNDDTYTQLTPVYKSPDNTK